MGCRQLEMEFSEVIAEENDKELMKRYRNPYHMMTLGIPIPKRVIEHSGPLTRNVDRMFRRGVVFGQTMFDEAMKTDLMVFMVKPRL